MLLIRPVVRKKGFLSITALPPHLRLWLLPLLNYEAGYLEGEVGCPTVFCGFYHIVRGRQTDRQAERMWCEEQI